MSSARSVAATHSPEVLFVASRIVYCKCLRTDHKIFHIFTSFPSHNFKHWRRIHWPIWLQSVKPLSSMASVTVDQLNWKELVPTCTADNGSFWTLSKPILSNML